MYPEGISGPKNPAWSFEMHAAEGSAVAQNILGIMYRQGSSLVPKNEAKAAEWFLKAAVRGNSLAQSNLARMYAEGRGVSKDDIRGLAWHYVVAQQNDKPAPESLETLEKQMTPEQKAEAQKLSAELLAGISKE
jgi:TPR repeat protein